MAGGRFLRVFSVRSQVRPARPSRVCKLGSDADAVIGSHRRRCRRVLRVNHRVPRADPGAHAQHATYRLSGFLARVLARPVEHSHAPPHRSRTEQRFRPHPVRGELTCGGPVPWLGSFAAFHPPPPASLHPASARFVRPRTHTAGCRGPSPLAELEHRHRRALQAYTNGKSAAKVSHRNPPATAARGSLARGSEEWWRGHPCVRWGRPRAPGAVGGGGTRRK